MRLSWGPGRWRIKYGSTGRSLAGARNPQIYHHHDIIVTHDHRFRRMQQDFLATSVVQLCHRTLGHKQQTVPACRNSDHLLLCRRCQSRIWHPLLCRPSFPSVPAAAPQVRPDKAKCECMLIKAGESIPEPSRNLPVICPEDVKAAIVWVHHPHRRPKA